MITVYGAPPTRALRVIWMLEEMNLPYDIRSVNFQTRFEDTEFMAMNPAGAVPAIRDGDTPLIESCAIMEYLGTKYGPTPLVPKPTDAHYPAFLSFLHFGEASLSGPLNVTIGSRFFAPEDQKQNWGAQFAIDLFVRKSAAVSRALSGQPYVAGGVFTAADISCGYAIGLAKHFGFDERLDPALREYAGRLVQRPAYQRAISKAQAPSA